MRLERLEVKGFMGFTEPAVLDLRDVPMGLVSITGENGHGKTRLLDAGIGAVYGEFPSRDGHLADYATDRDAHLEALYSLEGRGTYRSRINVDGLKRNVDGALNQILADSSEVPVQLPDGTKADGKISTHREVVAGVFPPKELLLASAFAAQNRAGSFVTLDRGKRKDLFGTLLGLEHYAAMAATAKAAYDVWESARARLAERRDLLARDLSGVADALEARANQLQQDLGAAELRRLELQAEQEGVEAERDGVAEHAAAHVAAVERREALHQLLGTTQADQVHVDTAWRTAQEAAAFERDTAAAAFAAAGIKADADEQAARAACAAKLADLDARIAKNRTLDDRAADIRQAVTDREAARLQLDELRNDEQQHADALETAREEVRKRERALIGVDEAQRSLHAAEVSVRTLIVVKFGEQCGGENPCKFVAKAVADQAAIPRLQQQIDEGVPVRTALEVWRDTVGKRAEAVKTAKIAIAQVEERIRALDPLATLESKLAETQARIDGYAREKSATTLNLSSLLQLIDERRGEAERAQSETIVRIAERLAAARQTYDTRRQEITDAQASIARQIDEVAASLPATEAAARRLAAIDGTELPALRRQWTENEATLAAVTARIAELERERAVFRAKSTEHAAVSTSLREAEARLLNWQVYVKAFGRDGLPTLEIAAAGPTVSNLTNDLLNVCFGSRFTVELVTQEARADRKGLKETFELKVFDNQHGGDARDLADLSGGERVIVDEALRAALALYVNSRNQAPIRTAFRDETTGALDPDNAVRYVAMLRRLQQLGGFHHVLYVTHNPDAARLADTEIVVTNGQPEFRRAA